MPLDQVLADSGLFIGLFDAADKHHLRCTAFLKDYRGRILTTWQVVTEALAMLDVDAQQRLLVWLDRGVKTGLVRIECTDPTDLERATELSRKYRNQPMDFADASIYLLALHTGIKRVASVDNRDFAVYRLPGKKHFENVLS
jgi:uncharacterized protein